MRAAELARCDREMAAALACALAYEGPYWWCVLQWYVDWWVEKQLILEEIEARRCA